MTINLPTVAELSVGLFCYIYIAGTVGILVLACIVTKGNPGENRERGNDTSRPA